MNLSEQMYADLKSQLPALTEAIKSGVGYGGELFHRFILFDIWTHVLGVAFTFILAALFITTSCQAYKRGEWAHGEPDNFAAILSIISGAGALVFLAIFSIALVVNTEVILKDIFVPELRVLEILSDLVSNS